MSGDTQDRLPPIPFEKLTDAQKKAAADFFAIRNTDVFGPFVPLIRSPEVMVRVSALGDQLRFRNTLPARLSEFVILITARQWTQQYEWYVHEPIALKAGLSPTIVKALVEGRRPERMAEDEEIVYTLCDELHRHRSVSDPTYVRAVRSFGEAGVIDLSATVGYYTLLAMVMNTAQTQLPPGVSPPLPPSPR